MKIIRYFQNPVILLVLLTFFSLVSCLKIKEDKIDGEWVRIQMWDLDPAFKEYWTFMNDVVTVEKEDTVIMPGDTVATLQRVEYDVGEYELSKTINRTYIQISGFSKDYTYNKKWQVIDLDKEIFSLASTAGNGLVYLEFYSE